VEFVALIPLFVIAALLLVQASLLGIGAMLAQSAAHDVQRGATPQLPQPFSLVSTDSQNVVAVATPRVLPVPKDMLQMRADVPGSSA
jgi:hypothetical protein